MLTRVDNPYRKAKREPIQRCYVSLALITRALFVLLIIVGSLPCLGQTPKKRHLIVGSEQEFPPFATGMTSNEAGGFTVELWKEVAKLNDLDYEIRVLPFKELLTQFKAGKIDVLLNLAQSEERSRFADFTVPHVISHGAIFVQDGTVSIRTEQDLKDRKVILIDSGLPFDYFHSHYPAQQTILVPNVQDGFKALASGKGDAFVISRVMGLMALENLHQRNIHALSAKVGFTQRFSFAVRKGDSDLLGDLNDGLDSLKESDRYDQLYARWFDPYEAKYGEARRNDLYLMLPLVGALVIAIFLLLRALRRQKLYHASASDSEKRFKAVFDQAAVGISHVRENGQFIMVNDRLCEIIGYEREVLLESNFREITHPEDRDLGMEDLHCLVIGDGPPFSFEKRYIRKDGEIVWVRLFVSRQTLGPGVEPYIITVTEDITSEKQVESRLIVEQARYKALLEFAADAIFVISLDGVIEEVNVQAESLLCSRGDRLIGTSLLEYHYPTDREMLQRFFDQVQGNGSGSHQNVRLPSGTTGNRYVDITASAIRVSDRVVLRAAYRDVSNRVVNDLERTALATRLDLALKAGNIGTGAYYPNEDRLELDRRFLELIHVLPEDFTGNPEQLLESILPEDREKLTEILTSGVLNTTQTLTFRFNAEDGSIRHINVVIDRIHGSESKGDFLVGVAYDITDRVRAKQQLEKLSKAKDEFIARMSHELRTSLNIILGFGQILERQQLEPSQLSSVEQILKGGRHLLGMINEVLEHAKIEAGRLEVEYQAVDLLSICQEVCIQSSGLAEENHVRVNMGEIVIDGSVSDQCSAWGDPKMLRQVLINLVSNGIKYNRPNGSVQIHFHASKESVQISVQDTGIGITLVDQEKLFVPFERLSAKSNGVAGTGLGLTISREFLHAMHSDLTFRSVYSEGTCFEFILKRIYPTQLDETEIDDPDKEACKVLLFSRQPGSIAALLAQNGLGVFEADTWRSAVRLARHIVPRVVLVDSTISEGEIVQVIQRLKMSALTAELPVVLADNGFEDELTMRLLTCGVCRTYQWPNEIDSFVDALPTRDTTPKG